MILPVVEGFRCIWFLGTILGRTRPARAAHSRLDPEPRQHPRLQHNPSYDKCNWEQNLHVRARGFRRAFSNHLLYAVNARGDIVRKWRLARPPMALLCAAQRFVSLFAFGDSLGHLFKRQSRGTEPPPERLAADFVFEHAIVASQAGEVLRI